jgi:cupin 2 domain-containing protein
MTQLKNLFSNIPTQIPEELFETLSESDSIKIERIISKGQSTPSDEWLFQEWNEWVILLQGTAGIKFENEKDILVMKPGDYIFIPAKTRHRVEWTDAKDVSIWLALHYR